MPFKKFAPPESATYAAIFDLSLLLLFTVTDLILASRMAPKKFAPPESATYAAIFDLSLLLPSMLPRTPYIKPTFKLILESALLAPPLRRCLLVSR
jgi:hypothetical protein